MSERYTTYEIHRNPRIVVPGHPTLSVIHEFSVQFRDYAYSALTPSPYDVDIDICWDRDDERYVVTSLRAIGMVQHPITSENLRSVPVGQFLRLACEAVPNVVADENGGDPFSPDYYSDAERTTAKLFGPTPETLAMVAMVYRAAELAAGKPAWWVGNRFGIPQRTATHWVKLARERGHLSGGDDG